MGRDAKLRLQLNEALESWYRKAVDAGDEELLDRIVVLSSWCFTSCSDVSQELREEMTRDDDEA